MKGLFLDSDPRHPCVHYFLPPNPTLMVLDPTPALFFLLVGEEVNKSIRHQIMECKFEGRKGETKTNQPSSGTCYLPDTLSSYPKGIFHAFILRPGFIVEKTEILHSGRVVHHFVAQFVGVKANTRNIFFSCEPSILKGFILKKIPNEDTQVMTFRQYIG